VSFHDGVRNPESAEEHGRGEADERAADHEHGQVFVVRAVRARGRAEAGCTVRGKF
jgi:hypothetical protein